MTIYLLYLYIALFDAAKLSVVLPPCAPDSSNAVNSTFAVAVPTFAIDAVVTKPPQGVTVGQAWLMTLGDTFKIALGLVIPGLLLAGFIEAFITPQVVVKVLGG